MKATGIFPYPLKINTTPLVPTAEAITISAKVNEKKINKEDVVKHHPDHEDYKHASPSTGLLTRRRLSWAVNEKSSI